MNFCWKKCQCQRFGKSVRCMKILFWDKSSHRWRYISKRMLINAQCLLASQEVLNDAILAHLCSPVHSSHNFQRWHSNCLNSRVTLRLFDTYIVTREHAEKVSQSVTKGEVDRCQTCKKLISLPAKADGDKMEKYSHLARLAYWYCFLLISTVQPVSVHYFS